MTDDKKINCTETSPEELLLLAYGDSRPPRLAEHVKHCPRCQAFLQDVRATRAQVRLPLAGPSASTLAAVRRQAEALAHPGAEGHRPAWTRTAGTGRALAALFARPLAPAFAAAAIVVMAVVLTYPGSRPGSGPGNGPASDYLTGVSADLLRWGRALDAGAAPSASDAHADGHQPDSLNELEVAADDAERDLPLLNYSDLTALGADDDGPSPEKE